MIVQSPPSAAAQADAAVDVAVDPVAGAGAAAYSQDKPLFVIGRGDPPESDESEDTRVQFGPLHVAVREELSPKLGAKKKKGGRRGRRVKDQSYDRSAGSRLRPNPRPVHKTDM